VPLVSEYTVHEKSVEVSCTATVTVQVFAPGNEVTV
jgi:hypothetical protein